MTFQSGNKFGRGRPPAGKSLTEALRVALQERLRDGRTRYRAVADTMVQRAIEGDVAAAREIFNRVEGPITAVSEADRNTKRPIVVTVLPQDKRLL